mmetsp:Transcript_24062/g.39815  ORF Transcript_24062/g.39815 Transcript_24062/m.39815 type:complete len:89 (+) Transcript_24062:78-344(+)
MTAQECVDGVCRIPEMEAVLQDTREPFEIVPADEEDVLDESGGNDQGKAPSKKPSRNKGNKKKASESSNSLIKKLHTHQAMYCILRHC